MRYTTKKITIFDLIKDNKVYDKYLKDNKSSNSIEIGSIYKYKIYVLTNLRLVSAIVDQR